MVWKKQFEQYVFAKIIDSRYLDVSVKLGRIHAKPPEEFSEPSAIKQNIEIKGGRSDRYDCVEEVWDAAKNKVVISHNNKSIGCLLGKTSVRKNFQESIGIYCTTVFGKTDVKNSGVIDIPTRFNEFGDCAIFITDAQEWLKRILRAIQNHPHIKCCRIPGEDAWCGKIEYMNLNSCGRIGFFKKSLEYSWQSEFRMLFMDNREVPAINLDIGSIEDISTVVFFNPKLACGAQQL